MKIEALKSILKSRIAQLQELEDILKARSVVSGLYTDTGVKFSSLIAEIDRDPEFVDQCWQDFNYSCEVHDDEPSNDVLFSFYEFVMTRRSYVH